MLCLHIRDYDEVYWEVSLLSCSIDCFISDIICNLTGVSTDRAVACYDNKHNSMAYKLQR